MTLARKLKLGFYSIALGCSIAYWYSVHYPTPQVLKIVSIAIPQIPVVDSLHLNEALDYCIQNGYSTQLSLIINLAPHSGRYRLFAFNLETHDTLVKGLVAHGHCKSTDNRFAQFSNEIGSNCSSLGHYKVGGKYEGSYGTSYKLIGRDSTNSNALNRFVVLHSHSCVSDYEQEDDICLSEGCTTVSPKVLQELIPYLDNTAKPIMLWIYS